MSDKTSTFTNNSPPTVDATWLNMTQDERNNIITAAGITVADATNDQVSKAISTIIGNATYYTDSGAADAYVLSVVSPNDSPQSYRVGMLGRFRTANANTGASQVNIAGLGAKSIKLQDGSTDPSAGDISTAVENTIVYDGTNFRLVRGGREEFTNIQINNKINLATNASTISSGSIAYAGFRTFLTGEGDVADSLAQITGGTDGDEIMLCSAKAYNITITHNASFLDLQNESDVILTSGDTLLLRYQTDHWVEYARSLRYRSANQPAFFAYRTGTNQSVTTAVKTKVEFNGEDFDVGSYYDSASTFRFTPLIAGKYLVIFSVEGEDAGTVAGGLSTFLQKNGADHTIGRQPYYDNGNAVVSQSCIVDMNGSTDYLEVYATIGGTNNDYFALGRGTSFGAFRLIE